MKEDRPAKRHAVLHHGVDIAGGHGRPLGKTRLHCPLEILERRHRLDEHRALLPWIAAAKGKGSIALGHGSRSEKRIPFFAASGSRARAEKQTHPCAPRGAYLRLRLQSLRGGLSDRRPETFSAKTDPLNLIRLAPA